MFKAWAAIDPIEALPRYEPYKEQWNDLKMTTKKDYDGGYVSCNVYHEPDEQPFDMDCDYGDMDDTADSL